eukprot:TRINITY_DN24548_c1_g1_i1.p7 TRINITY_DN24548_c1_g1~~TRINITY_DN24548_c1_g1_i1.p7  ORF type:complete len:139 (+),score=6.95 TRINITY_DN24548_c1_g1_i1:1120-1536(+)
MRIDIFSRNFQKRYLEQGRWVSPLSTTTKIDLCMHIDLQRGLNKQTYLVSTLKLTTIANKEDLGFVGRRDVPQYIVACMHIELTMVNQGVGLVLIAKTTREEQTRIVSFNVQQAYGLISLSAATLVTYVYWCEPPLER